MQTKECCAKCFMKETCNAQLTCSEKKDLIIEIVREQELKKVQTRIKTRFITTKCVKSLLF